MEKRNRKQNDYSTMSKEVVERRTIMNETMRNHVNGAGKRMDRSEHLVREDDEDGVIEPEESVSRKGIKKGQALKLQINPLEDEFFEEPKLEVAEKPVITFNHVCTVTESEQISFEAIKKSGSRSPSPLLEVPAFKVGSKQAMRPPPL